MIVQLGKFGDCCNVLPYAFYVSKKIGTVNWLIGRQYSSILDGVSYVNPIIWEGSDDTLPQALAMHRGKTMWITQAWMNPDTRKMTDSFAKESWRYVGALDQFGRWPLVFDKRNPEREQVLIDACVRKGKLTVLVGMTSVSTPYRHAVQLAEKLRASLSVDVWVMPMDFVKAYKIYDLIGLYDAADLIVTIDTVHAHLARASQTPVIFLRNDLNILGTKGWSGAVPPPQAIATWGYSELGSNLVPVVEAARKQLARKVESVAVVCDTFNPSTDRHKRAMATHPEGTIYVKHEPVRSMKYLLGKGLNQFKDAVIFTHDDVTFTPDTMTKIKAHLQKWDFGCSRRPRTPVHCGREIFWFRSDWLRKNWEAIPDPFWSLQKCDLIMARWLRSLRGIPTTLENLNYDFPPVELPNVIEHEDHQSHWANKETEGSPEGVHNERLWEAGV